MDATKGKAAKKIAIGLGQAIRARREQADISQDELAWRAEVHRAYMGTIERGQQNITVFKLFQIARALGLKPSDILKDIGL
ncbi:helix-turn-helix domain-containing protein [Cerasicoccus fimbriatus]|uniref:helix-turn-helix domain-containing protein n=1 Tax=Cerasicoccus fimbriatus TaxID=3014554 RepID=UPI0022B5BBA3|nr:helix-turn-helix transcriptional regulator [Cerasicoccus sp. TK19100]